MTGADIGLGWIDRSGQLHFQVYRTLISFSLSRAVCLSIDRIDMHIQLHDQSLIIQPSIGVVFKVEKKMDGQLFNSDALLIRVIQWMFPSKFVFHLFSKNDDILCDVVIVWDKYPNLCIWS
jgi:hypothetical protein